MTKKYLNLAFDQAVRICSVILFLFFFNVVPATAAPPDSTKPENDEVKAAATLLDQWRGDDELLDRAQVLLDRVLAVDARNAPAHREYTRLHLMRSVLGNGLHIYEEMIAAEKSLLEALRINPEFVEAHVLAGHLYFLQKRYAESRQYLEKAEKFGTNDPWLHLNWADLLMAEKKVEEAGARYKRVVESQTPNKKAMRSAITGMIEYYRLKNVPVEREKYFKLAIETDPLTASKYVAYSQFLLCQDRYEAAIETVRKGISLRDYRFARTMLAGALYRKAMADGAAGRAEAAETAAAEARQYNAESPEKIYREWCGENSPVWRATFKGQRRDPQAVV